MHPLVIDQQTAMNYLVPLSPCDGTLVGIQVDKGTAQLLFYQVRKQTGNHIDKVDVIGAIGMSVKDLELYRNAITENLNNLKNREQ